MVEYWCGGGAGDSANGMVVGDVVNDAANRIAHGDM